MQQGFIKSFKRAFYIEQLRLAGINQVEGKPLELANERELKYALAKARATAS